MKYHINCDNNAGANRQTKQQIDRDFLSFFFFFILCFLANTETMLCFYLFFISDDKNDGDGSDSFHHVLVTV